MPQSSTDAEIASAVRTFYERHPYPGSKYPIFKKQARRLSAFMPRSGAVFFPGCGTGQTMVALAALRQDLAVYGIDLSDAAINIARRLAQGQPRVFLARGDFTAPLPWNRQFTYIVCEGVLHHVPRPSEALRALVAKLEDDGGVFLNLYGESYHRRRLEIVEMLNILADAAGDSSLQYRYHLYQALRKTELAGRGVVKRSWAVIKRLGLGTALRALALVGLYEADSLPHDQKFERLEAAWIDQYAHPFERTFNTLEAKQLLDEAGLEVVEMLYLGRRNEAALPVSWRPLFRRLDQWTQFRLMELYEPLAGSIYLWAKRKASGANGKTRVV